MLARIQWPLRIVFKSLNSNSLDIIEGTKWHSRMTQHRGQVLDSWRLARRNPYLNSVCSYFLQFFFFSSSALKSFLTSFRKEFKTMITMSYLRLYRVVLFFSSLFFACWSLSGLKYRLQRSHASTPFSLRVSDA